MSPSPEDSQATGGGAGGAGAAGVGSMGPSDTTIQGQGGASDEPANQVEDSGAEAAKEIKAKQDDDATLKAEATARAQVEAEKVAQAKAAEEAEREAAERRRAEEWRQTKLHALGQPVYYRSGAPHQDGHEGTTLHAGIITMLHEDWSADLTVFPRRAGMYHVERAPIARVEDPEDCGLGCYRPRD